MGSELIHQVGGPELFEDLRPLWLELNRHHARLAPALADHFAAVTFERRMALLSDRSRVRVDLLREPGGTVIAYAFGSLDGHGRGELESIFVASGRRGHGHGQRLARAQLAWLRELGAWPIRVTVSVGNEAALPFYRSLGFHHRASVLWLDPEDAG
jgi:GNAT superfamily N-acetyltransferase